ncbi:ATP-dependent helicase [uncultured Azohydromonas sp.]|jgi:Superfamily I DNA and RNA helicases|uniref:ATP-dependent helicase n=1 Tax=uncultured Azohydromonas sp. TaxID=487342 RepID=UPI00260D73E4|nr:ATP-dependent helicase [uncultured Azohydromonas sp.]
MIAADAWSPADEMTLEPNALKAAKEQDRCLVLTAGPGAGKTEMLAQRADFLLRTGTCRYPRRVLAISFKVDASKNLKERVQRRCGRDLSSRLDSYTFHAFAKRIIDKFRPVLTGKDALDAGYKIGNQRISRKQIEFSDLVPLAIQILENSVVARNAIRQTYTDVFLDEFQDCTDKQYELVKLAFLGTSIRLTAVGDVKQKIMGWAGALDGIFKKFEVDFRAVSLHMYRNFRSQPRLLRLQNEIIRVLDPASVMPDEQLMGDGGKIFAWSFKNCEGEANFLADMILSLIEVERVPLSEIAVLVSRQLNLYAAPLMSALERRGVPFRNEQEIQDISTEPVARLIVDYLSCLYGEREPKAWTRLIELMAPFADEDVRGGIRLDFLSFIKNERKNRIDAHRSKGAYFGWWESVCAFLEKVGIEGLTALSPDYESHNRLGDVIFDAKSKIEELMKLEPDLPKALMRFSDDQAVRILTIHKSKGLEFESVIMIAVEDEIFFGDADENRCAFFVGVSRAKRRLVVTHAWERAKPVGHSGNWTVCRSPQKEYIGYVLPFINNK